VPNRREKPYHHGDLRSALIDGAVTLIAERGERRFSLAELSRSLGVSAAAPYRHFADRDELLAEIASLAAAQLEQAMQRRLDGVRETDPATRARARLRETGRAYVEFALSEPGLFSVAFCPIETDDPSAMSDAAPYLLLGQVLDELVEAGALSPASREGADVACWAAVHGLSVLLLDGPLGGLPPADREAVLEKLLATIEQGLTGSMG
jgi:AcrR family transcriptional regulator